jgi:hypothetical protein
VLDLIDTMLCQSVLPNVATRQRNRKGLLLSSRSFISFRRPKNVVTFPLIWTMLFRARSIISMGYLQIRGQADDKSVGWALRRQIREREAIKGAERKE